MSDVILQVDNLGKKFRMGAARPAYGRFSELLVNGTRQGVRWARNRAVGLFSRGNSSAAELGEHEFWALKDVSFEVKRGEVLGIIGRNGAGKSTLLKLLSRISRPTTGEIRLRGRVGSLLEVGTGFHPELTGRENIFLNGAILGMTRREINRKFDEIVDFSGVEQFLETPVKHYSSGMYVRLAFAVAAHLEPEILLVDEVLAVGDAEFQKKCLGKMGEVARGGRTVLFVSHNMGAIQSLCSCALLLQRATIAAIGPPVEIVDEYHRSSQARLESGMRFSRRAVKQSALTSLTVEHDGSFVGYGGAVVFRIGYDFCEPVVNPQFCVLVSDLKGSRVFSLISAYQKNEVPHVLSGMGEVMCRIEKLPLAPGTYAVHLRLWQPGEKLDDIENAAELTVEWGDRLLCVPHTWSPHFGPVYVDATWQRCELQ